MTLFRLLLCPRALVGLAVISLACFISHNWSEHHHASNPFVQLYFHLVPAPLVHDPGKTASAREDYLLTIPAPGPLAALATNQGGHGADGHGDHDGGHGSDSHGDSDHGADHGESHSSEHGEAGTGEHAGDDHSDDHSEGGHAATEEHGSGDHGGHGADGHGEEAPFIAFTNLQVFQLASVLLVLILFSGVPGYLKTGRGDAVSKVLSGFVLWIRDEMVYPVMGKELGTKFLPYFLCLFFFILFMNLMGLVPASATATASLFVTAGLALITFGSMLGCGMAAQGPVAFVKNLVPHVPGALWPLMLIVEIIGLLVKPFALMIRLFANMTGGHMVVLSFMGLIFFFGTNEAFGENPEKFGYMVSPLAVGFGVFIMIIEGFVAMLQAYIFTQLSIIFVGASVHPEH